MNNELPNISNKTLIKKNTLFSIAEAIRFRRGYEQNVYIPVNEYSDYILNTDFGDMVSDEYGGVILSMTGLNVTNVRKYRASAVIGKNVVNCAQAFNSYPNLIGPPYMKSDICTDMYRTFFNCPNIFGDIYIGSSVENLRETFSGCVSLNSDVPNSNSVVDAYGSFYNCYSLKSAGKFKNATNMDNTYYNCTNLQGTVYGSDNVIGMNLTYYNCNNIKYYSGNEDSIQYLNGTFSGCTNLEGNILRPSLLYVMTNAYEECISLRGNPYCGPLVNQANYAYYNCTNITGLPQIGEDLVFGHNMYYNCVNLSGSPLFNSTIINRMDYMFYNCVNLSGTIFVNSTVIHASAGLIHAFYNTALDALYFKRVNMARAGMLNAFWRENVSKKLSIIFENPNSYNQARHETTCGYTPGAIEAIDEVLKVPFRYTNGFIYGYKDVPVKKISYNEEGNVYFYCTV